MSVAPASSFGGTEDAYVLKLNAAGTQLLYSTFLGGYATTSRAESAVDSAGSAYVTGAADSPNFPATSGALQRYSGGTVLGFQTDPPLAQELLASHFVRYLRRVLC